MPKYYNLPEYDERRRLQQELRQNVDKTADAYLAMKMKEKGNNGPVPGL